MRIRFYDADDNETVREFELRPPIQSIVSDIAEIEASDMPRREKTTATLRKILRNAQNADFDNAHQADVLEAMNSFLSQLTGTGQGPTK